VDLSLSPEQQALVASIADLLAKHSPSESVRKAEERGFDPHLWAVLAEFGAFAMAVPEDRGGWGAGLLELALVAEQLGAWLAPVPAVDAQVTCRLLAAIATPEAAIALKKALAGEQLVTVAVRSAGRGVATLVPGAAVADAVVVREGDTLLLVPLGPDNRRVVANLAADSLADVDLTVGPSVELATGSSAAAIYERAVDDWLTLTAALLVGSAAAAHRSTCEYATQRRTWGRPIGSYQGVSHPLADAATSIDGARLLVRKAAWARDGQQPRARELAAMAFAFAAESARDATYMAVHFHGGVGFTLEHDAQLHYRRVRGWSRVWGEPRDALLRVAAQRYPEENR
jgi:alkylation response protein AidB-like acyl-CoA dehydrogenase